MKLTRLNIIIQSLPVSVTSSVHAANTTKTSLFDLVDPVARNSTEYTFNLGTTPLSPYGDIRTSDSWIISMADGCPKLCSPANPDPPNWTHIHNDLLRCQEPILFDLNVHNNSIETLRACTASSLANSTARRSLRRTSKCQRRELVARPVTNLEATKKGIFSSNFCGTSQSSMITAVSVGPVGVLSSPTDSATAMGFLGDHLKSITICGQTLLFAKYRTAIVGLYASADIQTSTIATNVLDPLKSHVLQGSEMIQACDSNPHNLYTFGVFAVDSFKGLARAQRAFKHWVIGDCVPVTSASSRSTLNITVLGLNKLVSSNSTTTIDNPLLKKPSL